MNLNKLVLIIFIAATLVSCGRRQSSAGSANIPAGFDKLCGDSSLAGFSVPDITETGSSCGISNPVEVHYVSGVKLSTPATLNCNTARTLREWVDNAAQPSVANLNARITEMRVFASYSCRTRNSRPGARMSEHSLGNAIDIGGFTLSNGTVITVEDDWDQGREGKALRKMYSRACGVFGTTLSPDSDVYHQDHMHFDTASYRSGAYCG